MPNQDESELVNGVVHGDEGAFMALYDRYSGRVYGLSLRILGNTLSAEEATQDTFVKLWSRARLYVAERGPFVVWLLTIARRTALDRLRLDSRRPVTSESVDLGDEWQALPDKTTLEEESRWRSLYFAVQALAPEQRQVIELAYYQSMSQSEIAEVLGWPLGTVKTRMRAATQQLRKAWSEK